MKCNACGRNDIPSGAGWCCWCGKKIVKTRAKKTQITVPEPKQLPSGNWRIVLRKEGVSVTEPTKEQCEAKAIAIRAGYLEEVKTNSLTLSKAIDNYIEAKSDILSPSTIRGYKEIKRNRFKSYMQKDVSKISDVQWQKAVNEEAKTVSPKTIKNAWLLIATVLEFNGFNKPKIALPQAIQNETPFLEPEEIKKFISAIQGTEIEIPCLLGLSSMRASEVKALKWDNVDLKKRIIYVNSSIVLDENNNEVEKQTNKTKKSTRNIPIMMDSLYEALKRCENKDGYVVTTSFSTLSKRLKAACRAAGVKEISFHGLRHSFASLAAHIGMPEAIAMQIGGWSNDIIMKRIYTHILETDVNRYQNEMSNYYNG